MPGKAKIMFLCTGNSCRSQMAEGLAKRLGGDKVEIWSAGLEAHGVNPRAVKVMAEIGIDISKHTSDEIDLSLLEQMDYAITLCGDADERCPLTLPTVRKLHFPFADPAKATGTEEEIMAQFRTVRDSIARRLEKFLAEEVIGSFDQPGSLRD
ncbi:MAG: arsenate reductase (thioredoxin) [Firmicutes bacterium]|nr:arsenate reductase (thioredoxin) [Bacillota bacterium]